MTRMPGPNIGSGSGAYSVGLSYRPAFRPSSSSRPAFAKLSWGQERIFHGVFAECLPFILDDQAAECPVEQAFTPGRSVSM